MRFSRACLEKVQTSNPAALAWAMILGLLAIFGCGSDSTSDDPVLAKTKDGWTLRLSGFATEWNRVYPQYPFERATTADRQRLLEDIVNDEILVTLAKSQIPELSWLSQRRLMVEREDWLVEAFFGDVVGEREIGATDMARMRTALGRAAKLQRIVLANPAGADACYEALESGLPFDQAYEKFSIQGDAPRAVFEMGWTPPQKLPPEVVEQVFLDRIEIGGYSEPIRTPKGTWIVKLLGLRPETFDAGQQKRIDGAIRIICIQDTVEAHRERLSVAAGYKTFDENFPIVNKCFNAYWDSLSAEQPKANERIFMAWRSPTWLLSPEERSVPIYEFWGKTGTAFDFMESLHSINSLAWPTGGSREQRMDEIRSRIRRLFLREEAVRNGYDQRPEYLELVERGTRRAYLDDYYDRVLEPNAKVTPQEALARYESSPGDYQTSDRVSFAYIFFPAEKRAAAKEFLDTHRTDNSAEWARAARAIAAEDPSIVFDRDTGMLDIDEPPQDLFLLPLIAAAAPLETDQLTGLVEAEGGVAILRCNYRRHKAPQPREVAVPLAEGDVKKQKVDAYLAEVIAAAVKERGLEVHPDRVGTPDAEPTP